LALFSFLKASVTLHQKLLESLDIGVLVVLDVALEEMEELALLVARAVGTSLLRWSLPRLLFEIGSLVLEVGFLVLHLLGLLGA
jgi:hypothetical protein